MDETTHSTTGETIGEPIATDSTANDGALLSAFFTEAAGIEPTGLPTVGQLRWRAEVLARLEAEERRANRAGSPALVGVVLAGLGTLTLLALFLSGIDVGIVARLGAWLSATPWRLLLLVACVLSLTGCAAGVGLQRDAR